MVDDIIAMPADAPLALCHGVLAHLEFMAEAMRHRLVRDRAAAAAWRQRLLGRVIGGDWVADTMHRLESPGLMLGLAGTGYTLLRAARPDRVPSVLTLEPPAARHRR